MHFQLLSTDADSCEQGVIEKSMKKSEVLKEASVAIQKTEALEREVASWKKGAIQRQIQLDSISADHNNRIQEVTAAKDQVVEELKTSQAARATLLEKNKKLQQEIEGKLPR